MTVISKVKAYLELMRYKNCLMAGLSALVAVFITASILDYSLVGDYIGSFVGLLKIFSTVFLVTAGGNMLNDYYDVKIDRVNKPHRPIPSGRIGMKETLYLAALFFIIGIGVIYFICLEALVIGMINIVLLISYAKVLKRTILLGNFTVSYLTGSTFLFGAAFFGTEGIIVLMPLFLLAFLATAAREIVKDIEDVEGDSKDGAVTFPIRYGEKSAAYLAAFFGVVAIFLCPLPYFMDILSIHYFYVLAIGIFCIIYAIDVLLRKKEYAKSSKFFKIAMFLALAAFVVGVF
ncbi:MAG: geranylgeranylglycerol-phosphate geranylgeranyltransferase [Methanimicrococcus sp.]|nr:geranylgeranylglycerol-phosphate geranylgeranyltransferase [Methanimicrococcus sp.]